MTTIRAAFYARVSGEQQVAAHTIESQITALSERAHSAIGAAARTVTGLVVSGLQQLAGSGRISGDDSVARSLQSSNEP